MNRLSDQHIHLLIDEPIYVLPDHGDHPIEEPEKQESLTYQGGNRKGICVFHQDASDEDIAFLFKGLNALEIELEDIALFNAVYDPEASYPDHTIRITFSNSERKVNFDLTKEPSISTLQSIPLNQIHQELEIKKEFWNNLKDLFGKL